MREDRENVSWAKRGQGQKQPGGSNRKKPIKLDEFRPAIRPGIVINMPSTAPSEDSSLLS